jgi:hypothetical protein
MKIDLQDGSFIDTEKSTVRVIAFKPSGKWYASHAVYVTADNRWILDRGWDIKERLLRDDPTMKEFCPFDKWHKDMTYMFEAHQPDPGARGFCFSLINLQD